MVPKLAMLSLLTWLLSLGPAFAAPAEDPGLWLEEVTGKKALDWVALQNQESTRELAGSAEFKALDARFMDILNSDARIPDVRKIGDRYYNFWRDQRHERGIWRRTTLDEYRKAAPAWETVLDLDSLAKAEGQNWVWEGAAPLAPGYRRCLVSLSRGGADATAVREFDLVTRSFVPDGFALPESKSGASWIDEDRLYVSFAFDSSTMTTSGYPRIVKEWRRGTPLSAATPVYEGQASDVGAGAWHDDTPGFERDFVSRGITIVHERAVPAPRRPADQDREARRRRRRYVPRMAGHPAAHRLDRGGQDVPGRARCSRRGSRTSSAASATSTCCSSPRERISLAG